jgi:hypothetical protein
VGTRRRCYKRITMELHSMRDSATMVVSGSCRTMRQASKKMKRCYKRPFKLVSRKYDMVAKGLHLPMLQVLTLNVAASVFMLRLAVVVLQNVVHISRSPNSATCQRCWKPHTHVDAESIGRSHQWCCKSGPKML